MDVTLDLRHGGSPRLGWAGQPDSPLGPRLVVIVAALTLGAGPSSPRSEVTASPANTAGTLRGDDVPPAAPAPADPTSEDRDPVTPPTPAPRSELRASAALECALHEAIELGTVSGRRVPQLAIAAADGSVHVAWRASTDLMRYVSRGARPIERDQATKEELSRTTKQRLAEPRVGGGSPFQRTGVGRRRARACPRVSLIAPAFARCRGTSRGERRRAGGRLHRLVCARPRPITLPPNPRAIPHGWKWGACPPPQPSSAASAATCCTISCGSARKPCGGWCTGPRTFPSSTSICTGGVSSK